MGFLYRICLRPPTSTSPCFVCWQLCVLAYFLLRNLTIFARVRGIMGDVWQGCLSLRTEDIRRFVPLYTVGIWASYFCSSMSVFISFDFSADLGWMPALVMFVVGSIAVAVPTPNGADRGTLQSSQ